MKEKTTDLIRPVSFILIGVFFALSFAPCIDEIPVPITSAPIVEDVFSDAISFAPMFCGIITVIELLFLIFSRKTYSKIIRLILDIVKTAAPLPLIRLSYEILVPIGGLLRNEYRLNWLGYIIVVIGALNVLTDLADIIWKTEK